jgi:hypothetical protein
MDRTFLKNKGMESIVCSFNLCLQNNLDKQGFIICAISSPKLIISLL